MSYSMNKDVFPRFSHTSHLIGDNKLVLIGGLSYQIERSKDCSGQTIVIFNLDSHEFIEYQIANDRTSYGTPLLLNHTSFCDTEGGVLYIFGGGSNCFSFGMHMNKYILRIPLANIRL